MWSRVLFGRIVRDGNLTVIDPHGRKHRFGNGEGDEVAIRITRASADRAIVFNPYLKLAECYMDGGLEIEAGNINDFLDLVCRNISVHDDLPLYHLFRTVNWLKRRIDQFNPGARARRNVAHHYDLSGQLYDQFLDADRQYSCAYFENSDDSLERAQMQKKQHIAAKLLIEPGMRVLDIGCGWGGMALYLARECGAQVLGITLSSEQCEMARARAERDKLADQVEFRLQDYRDVDGQFDRIVSVGMFEHVGVNHYPTFFRKLRAILATDGVALIHSIARSEGPGATNPFLRKYIFPGGYSPALSEVLPSVESADLFMTDIEILRLHYAMTLRHWQERFTAARSAVKKLYDERFCRMWEFYLAGCEMAFRYDGHVVAQMQMTPSVDAVPITRDYIDSFKRQHPVLINS